MSRPHRNKGTIIIIALLVMAMIELVVLMIIELQSFEVMHTQDLEAHAQDLQMLIGGEKWAMGQVFRVMAQEGPNQQSYQLQPTKTPRGVISAELIDAQSKLDINSLRFEDVPGVENFLKTILKQSDVKDVLDVFVPFSSTYHFESPRSQVDAGSKIDEQVILRFLKSEVPHESIDSERNYISATELLRKKINVSDFKLLYPFLVALPESVGLNINTLPQEVLLSLSPKITPDLAESIIQDRTQRKGFKSIGELHEVPALTSIDLSKKTFVVKSTYYLSKVQLAHKDYTLILYSLLAASQHKDTIEVHLLWRSLGIM